MHVVILNYRLSAVLKWFWYLGLCLGSMMERSYDSNSGCKAVIFTQGPKYASLKSQNKLEEKGARELFL